MLILCLETKVYQPKPDLELEMRPRRPGRSVLKNLWRGRPSGPRRLSPERGEQVPVVGLGRRLSLLNWVDWAERALLQPQELVWRRPGDWDPK